MKFESELSNGRFCIPQCITCKKTVWPPAEFCNHCFGLVSLREGDFKGRVIEFSGKDKEYFCLVEFEGTIRIMAKISQVPRIDQTVKITKCGIVNGSYSFHVS